MTGPLSTKYGDETHTVYSGNTLNRLSHLREDQTFLQNCFTSPTALFLPLREFNPLLNSAATKLVWLGRADVEAATGQPYARPLTEQAAAFNPETDASGAGRAQVLFLGVDESAEGSTQTSKGVQVSGAPRFAVDVTVYEQATPDLRTAIGAVDENIKAKGSNPAEDFRSVIFGVHLEDAGEYSIIAEARIILDWINRVRFCGGCGRRNMSVWGGFKLMCPSSFAGKTECPTKGRITNLSFPRTDCCVIMAVISHDGDKVLIGRGKRFRGNMYSCLAGFLESGESIEDCVRREVYEEAGVRAGRVIMHSSQPWPYPANIMIGCLAEVADASPESAKIFLGHDEELLDAKWVSKHDLRLLCEGKTEADYSLPPSTSIAYQLLHAAAFNLY